MNAAPKPQALRPRPDAIPDALRTLPAWVAWRYEERGQRWTKPPRRADGSGYARTDDPTTWADFETARRAAERADGLGVVLTDDLAGVDLDHVLGADGVIEPWAAELIERFRGCYVERSPGGDGLRIFCRGTVRHSGKAGPGNRLEVYGKGSPRYLTVTGHRVGDGDVIEAQEALDWLHARYFEAPPPAEKRPMTTEASTGPMADEEVIRRAREAANGAKFSRLWAGDSGEDASAADAALIGILKFWTQDGAQLDRLFRRSGLMRPKWDEKRGATTYGERTLAVVLAMQGETYSAQRGSDASHPPPAVPATIDRKVAIELARKLLAPALRERDAPPFPVQALGPLAEACEAISTHGQVQAAMVAQCLLGAASLLTQGLWNVETLTGRRPLSLNLCTLGDSGDGKSTAQTAALYPVHEWQRKEAKRYANERQDFEKAKAKRKKDEDPPEIPRSPYRLMRDATVEGLRRDLTDGPCSQGVFTDEAAAILAGYGMSPDHRAKTAGAFSGLWDSGHLSVSRAGAPRVECYGRRVALHWLIQPMAAAEALSDPMLSALGFWPRFVVAWPAPQPPRLAQAFKPETLPAVNTYWARCNALLAETLPDDADASPLITLEADARALLGQAFERFEREGRRGELRGVKPFALRATEQACRVAGVLAGFGGRQTIGVDTLRGALAVVAYSLQTWRAILDEGAADPNTANALRLYEWLIERPGWRERLATIVNGGPTCVRSKDKRDAALDVLIAHGLAEVQAGDACALVPPDEGQP